MPRLRSTRQIAHHRREKRYRWITGYAIFKGIAIQTDLSRPLGYPARDVSTVIPTEVEESRRTTVGIATGSFDSAALRSG
jgi:hypothetical protein